MSIQVSPLMCFLCKSISKTTNTYDFGWSDVQIILYENSSSRFGVRLLKGDRDEEESERNKIHHCIKYLKLWNFRSSIWSWYILLHQFRVHVSSNCKFAFLLSFLSVLRSIYKESCNDSYEAFRTMFCQSLMCNLRKYLKLWNFRCSIWNWFVVNYRFGVNGSSKSNFGF